MLGATHRVEVEALRDLLLEKKVLDRAQMDAVAGYGERVGEPGAA